MDSHGEKHFGKSVFWNTVASTLNALQGVLFLAVVNRTVGPYLGGVFSFAYMIGQQFRPLGAFEMRVYQATDAQETFPFGTYWLSRVITSLLMLAAIIITAVLSEGASSETIAVIVIASLRVLDVFEDVYQGKLQQIGRLDLAARALSIRICITTIAFCILLLASADLLVTAVTTFAISALFVYLLNVPISRRYYNTKVGESDSLGLPRLLVACFPLFLSAFLSNYLPNSSKFAVEAVMSKEALAQYSALFMPAMVVNLLCGFIFQPLLSRLAILFSSNETKRFFAMIMRGLVLSAIIGVVAMCGACLVGIPILEFIYGVELNGLLSSLALLMMAGIFNAFDSVLYYGLVAMRGQRLVLVAYAMSSVLALFISGSLVIRFGIPGAAFSYAVTMASLFAFLLASMLYFINGGHLKRRAC